jgi:hypothetical protein
MDVVMACKGDRLGTLEMLAVPPCGASRNVRNSIVGYNVYADANDEIDIGTLASHGRICVTTTKSPASGASESATA